MPVAEIIGGVLGGLVAPITNYFQRKRELSLEEHKAALEILRAQGERQAQLIRDGLAADANWEMEFARQASTSWKDEYTLFLFSIPAVLAFIPGYDQIVKAGFAAISEMPVWYQTGFLTMSLATIGVRWWRRTQSDT